MLAQRLAASMLSNRVFVSARPSDVRSRAAGWAAGRACAPPTKASARRHCSAHAAQYTEYSLSTEDRLEITELCYRFDAAINSGQQAALGRFFTQNAELVTPAGALKGPGPIVTYFQSIAHLAAGNRHLTLNMLISPDGHQAARVSAYRLLLKASSPPVLLASGTIEDRLVNVGGEWRFASRVFAMDPPAAAAAAGPAAAAANGGGAASIANGAAAHKG